VSRLKELRLHGFKTFADPTRFVFEPGVNAVIGPNGSGKSNMADAVRWVLGEQSNRSLRTRRADDVIFAGSQGRRPQGMAEAILTLDNADGWLPIDFAEVTIGRRAYRSGESEYLINGARAKLRDVVELLGEGRLGASELVVVGQGTVDAALSLRPDERRQLFEEAAGVKNLQVRKNEALARLVKARDNRTRLADLIGELRPQVRRLALQAQHQQEHDQLGARARALVSESHRRREAAMRSALGEARRRAAAAEAAVAALRGEQAAGRQAVTAAEERYWQAEAAARAATERREGTREALIRSEGRVETLAARVAELAASIAAGEQELADVGEADAQPASAEATRLLRAAARAESAWRATSDSLAEADAQLLAAEETLADARRRDSRRIAESARRGELQARAAARREGVERELEMARRELAEAEGRSEPSGDAVATAEQAVAAAREHLEQLLHAQLERQPQADAARRHASELAERVGAMRGELDALRERAAPAGRLGSQLSAAGWSTLLEALDVPAEAWPAIEAVVGGELEQALVWRSGDLVDRLADARGAARLLATGDGVGASGDGAERDRAMSAVDGNQTLADWVGGAAVPRIFHRTVLASDVAALVRGWPDLPAGWLSVTRQGDLADGRGLVSLHGRGETTVGEAAQRHARRQELAEMLGRAEAEQDEAAAAAARELGALSEAGRTVEEARNAVARAESSLRSLRSEIEALAEVRQRAVLRVEVLEAELRSLPGGGDPAVSDGDGDATTSLAALERRAAQARDARAAASAARDAARAEWQAAQEAADRADEREAEQRRGRLLAEARRAHLSAALPRQGDGHRATESELRAAESALTAARSADEAAGLERAVAESQRDARRAELLDLERGESGSAGRLAELEREASSAAGDAIRHEEALSGLARERELALDALPDRSAETGQPDGALIDEVGAMSDADIEAEVRRLRRTLAQIGSVNPFAVEEHRELAARLEEMTEQEADLDRATIATEELIARLDADISQQFNAAFVAIGERFDEFCRLLFAGGSASLQLGEGEDGEAPGGIEIVVRPPGKRLQRLAMLSGGERALTGVALLFAMLSVNPLPFCILDEVDAALDEANIGRFAEALRTLAQRIDFVVITHNRATIEVADTIYGVTMTDAAVSLVISLRLADLAVEAVVG
jgi:chromosome segregation protein